MNATAARSPKIESDRTARRLAADLPPGYTLRGFDLGHGTEWWVCDERGQIVDGNRLGAGHGRQRFQVALLLALCMAGLVVALGLYAG